MEDQELAVGEQVVLLRGNVVEVFHKTGLHQAFHVRHLAVEGKPRKDGDLDVTLGIESFGMITNGTKLRVPPAQQDQVMALFAEARRRRDDRTE